MKKEKEDLLVLIDDDRGILNIIEVLLSEDVSNIRSYINPLEALKDLENKINPSCVICDINMPEMSGIEVLKTFREHNKSTPFYFFTGSGEFIDKAIEEEECKDKITGIFHKPDITSLVKMLKTFYEDKS